MNTFKTNPPCPPSNQLLNIVKASLDKSNSEIVKPATDDYKSLSHLDLLGGCSNLIKVVLVSNRFFQTGIDFDYESDKKPKSPDASQYETCYVTSHKAPCRTAAFDKQGIVIATGSVDASIKILDIDRSI